MKKFYAHGLLTGHVDGSIFVIEGTGPWNIECFENPAMDVDAIHRQLDGTTWGVLSVIHGEALHTPDAIKYLIQCIISDQEKGRCATAVVLETNQFINFSKRHLSEIYRAANERFEIFKNTELAKQWLENQIKQEVENNVNKENSYVC